jgi:hypothetical protein
MTKTIFRIIIVLVCLSVAVYFFDLFDIERESNPVVAGVAAFVGGTILLKMLLWDWKQGKKDSTDRSFKLRR